VNIKGEWENVKGYRAGMGEIEKNYDLKSLKQNFFSGIKKSQIILVKISPFRMKKFEINELI
jgi:hypothetical protein